MLQSALQTFQHSQNEEFLTKSKWHTALSDTRNTYGHSKVSPDVDSALSMLRMDDYLRTNACPSVFTSGLNSIEEAVHKYILWTPMVRQKTPCSLIFSLALHTEKTPYVYDPDDPNDFFRSIVFNTYMTAEHLRLPCCTDVANPWPVVLEATH